MRDELVEWVRNSARRDREHTFVTHGEPTAVGAMRERIVNQYRWEASVPILGESIELR